MSVWRYTAIDLRDGTKSSRRRGELAGDSAADVRASLRRVGLQVIEIKPARSRRLVQTSATPVLNHVAGSMARHLRSRRRSQRCELYDSLATMLESGIPLLEAVQTIGGDGQHSGRILSPRRFMLLQMCERLRSGSALDQAMSEQPAWYDEIEIAMVRAGQHGGELPRVLRSLAQQHERSGELSQKLIAALAYPTIIAIVGIGVVIFLSVKTLPDLTRILVDSGLEIPALTSKVMAVGQGLAGHWHLVLLLLAAVLSVIAIGPGLLTRRGARCSPRYVLSPSVVRRMAVGGLSLRLTDLMRTGVPVVDALRVLAPTVSSRHLRSLLEDAADRVERGDELSQALSHPRWFDSEYRRFLDIGQAAGELDVLLERMGLRYQRQARRLIDRLAALLEPCVMLALAVLVGVVVMAAVLPLIRLQEVL